MRVLVTGGAGYVGSHAVKALGELGHEVFTIDDLSAGHREAVLYGRLIEADLSDKNAVAAIVKDLRPEAVMHFAASSGVEESVIDPLKYYKKNVAGTLSLLEAMSMGGVNKLIFSSSASVYGVPEKIPVKENSPLMPINPYGRSKACVEGILSDLSNAGALRYVSLRYFNAAGADPGGRIGESHNPETHLIPLLLKAAQGGDKTVKIFGADYPTPDGTCVRDFVHVGDIARAHVLSLRYLMDGGDSEVFNIGYGHGHSVREVIEAAKRVTGIGLKAENAPRRPGDPASLVADPSRIKAALGFRPEYEDLEYIIKTAWGWSLNPAY